jgi:hypothetical protein
VRDTARCCSVDPALHPIKIRLSQGSVPHWRGGIQTMVYAL